MQDISTALHAIRTWKFCWRRVLKLDERFSDHCRAIKSHNVPQSRLQVVNSAALWSTKCKILACVVRACAESKISIWFIDFYFSLFLPHFFSFAEDLVRFILVRKVFENALRILGLEERKGRWVLEQDFKEIFRSMLHGFSPFSSVSLIESCLFWYGLKDLFTLHKLADKVSLEH